MKKIKIVLVFILLAGFASVGNAQSGIIIEASQLFASFKFSDSQSTSLNSEYSGIFTGAYGMNYRFITDNGIILHAGIGVRNAGATMVYDDMNYKWNLQYTGLKLGAGYMLKNDIISPYLTVSGYYAFLLRGFQTINNEDFDIKDSGSISENDLGIYVTPGVQFELSEALAAFVEFNYMMGLQNIEIDKGQKSANYAYGLSLGIAISFGN